MSSEQQIIARLQASPPGRDRFEHRQRRGPDGFALTPGGLRLPVDVLVIGVAAAGFALVTLLLSLASGAPFVIPTERVSPALGLHAAVPLGFAALGYLACQALAQRWRARPQAPDVLMRRTLTDLFFLTLFVVVAYFHFHIKMWMPVLNPLLHDELYFAIDERARWIVDGAAALRSAVGALLPAVDMWYQGAQLSLFILSFWIHAVGDRRWHHHNMSAILLNLMIGPLAYLVAPAVGPFIFEQGPNVAATVAQQEMYRQFLELQAQGPSWLAEHGGAYFTAPLAAMPSLHVSLACIVSYYALWARLAMTPLILFLAGWIVIESVVARWHYLVDVPAGVLLAVVVIALTNRLCRSRHGAGAPNMEAASATM